MKKLITLISLCLAVVMVLPLVASCTTGEMPFTDVKAGKWYYNNVKYVYENGIMNGVTDSKFDPNGTLTRGMCATIIYRMAGSPITYAENKFEDVKAGKYYTKAIAWAQDVGIVNGRSETVFFPDSDISRAEFATILYRYADTFRFVLPWKTDSYPSDCDKIPEFAEDAVNFLFHAKIIIGREDGRFQPMAKITRTEAAAMIDRFLNTVEKKPITGDDDVLGIAFFGDSFTYVPKIPEHFGALAEGKHEVKVYNRTHAAWTLQQHYDKWSQRDASLIKELTKDWDVVVLNEMTTADAELNEGIRKKFINLLGEDKTYYANFLAFLTRTEEGMEIIDWIDLIPPEERDLLPENSSSGFPSWWKFKRLVGISTAGHTFGEPTEFLPPTNDTTVHLIWDMYINNGVRLVGINNVNYDASLGLKAEDFYEDDHWHPGVLTGYMEALALYCVIYDEPAVGQNRGVLKDRDIPGYTPEEKNEFVLMLQTIVQEQVDMQNAH